MSTLRHLWHLFLLDFWNTAASSQFDTPDKARYFEEFATDTGGSKPARPPARIRS